MPDVCMFIRHSECFQFDPYNNIKRHTIRYEYKYVINIHTCNKPGQIKEKGNENFQPWTDVQICTNPDNFLRIFIKLQPKAG